MILRTIRRAVTITTTLAIALAWNSASAMPNRRMEPMGDYFVNFNFMVEISGVSAGYFKGVDGLSVEQEIIDFQDGEDLIVRKRTTKSLQSDITLKKGSRITKDLRNWWAACRRGKTCAKDVSIVLANKRIATQRCRWTLRGASLKSLVDRAVTKSGKKRIFTEIRLRARRSSTTCAKLLRRFPRRKR